MDAIIMGMVALLILLQYADFLLTQQIIQLGGVEKNPILVFLQKSFVNELLPHERWLWLALPKVVFSLVLLTVYAGKGFHTPGGFVILALAIAVYGWVVTHNYNVLDSMRMKGDDGE